MSLNKRALHLVITRSMPQMRKADNAVTFEVQTSHGSSADSGKYNKELYTRKNRMLVQKPTNLLRTFIRQISHPWGDRGGFITPTTLYEQGKLIIAKYLEDIRIADEHMKDNFHECKRDGERDLDEMYKESDYPSESVFRSKFFVDVEVKPVPISVPANHLYGLIQDDKAADKEEFKRILKQAEADNLKSVTESCAQRVFSAVQHVISGIDKKQAPKKSSAKRNATYKDSLIGNIWDLVQILPDLNLADSPEIADLHAALKDNILKQLDIENISQGDRDRRLKVEMARMRENKKLENSMKGEAQTILEMANAILPQPENDE